ARSQFYRPSGAVVRAGQCPRDQLGRNPSNMEASQKAQQELEEIERQVALIEATAGQNEEAHRQLANLQERVHILREEMKGLQTAWQKTELARHPQRPQ